MSADGDRTQARTVAPAPDAVAEVRDADATSPPRSGDDDLVRGVARRFGMEPRAVTHLGGVVNRVYRVTGSGEDWVVRLPVDPRDDVYPVEAWAVAAAQRAGLATPALVAVGVEAGLPFMVSQFVPPAAEAVGRPWTWLGRYARVVADIDLDGVPAGIYSRFGSDLELAWRRHVAYNLDALHDGDPLLAAGAYRREDRARVRQAIESVGGRSFSFGLAHGDLAPRNLLSHGRDEPPVLIDWGNAGTGPAPWTDAQRVYQWAVCHGTIEGSELAEFLEAAGADDETVLAELTVLQLVDVARWAAERRPDLFARYLRECQDGLRRVLPRVESPESPVTES